MRMIKLMAAKYAARTKFHGPMGTDAIEWCKRDYSAGVADGLELAAKLAEDLGEPRMAELIRELGVGAEPLEEQGG